MSRSSGRRGESGLEALLGGCASLVGGCIVFVVLLGLFFIFLSSTLDDMENGRPTEPAWGPDATAETVAPPASSEEEAEGDDIDGAGGRDFDGQTGIQFGYSCSPVGALGIAEDGRPAKCFMGKDGRARWGYYSKRG